MGRLSATISLTVRHETKGRFKLELIRMPHSKRYWVRINDKVSMKHESLSWTEAINLIREWGK